MMARLGFPMGKPTTIQVKQLVQILLQSSIFVSCGKYTAEPDKLR